MSSSRLQKFVKPLENNIPIKKASSEMDDFWEDCIDTTKLNENENKKKDRPNSNNSDENPEDYITCIFLNPSTDIVQILIF